MRRSNAPAYSTHRTRCEARFVTYCATTETYIGNDGRPKRCKL